VVLRGGAAPLDGHALLCRLKVAAALAIFAGRFEVNDEDWQLSEAVMRVSDATRAGVVAHLSAERSRANKARAEAEGDRAVVIEAKRRDADTGRVAKVIMRGVRKGGQSFTRRELAHFAASRDRRAHADQAIDALITTGVLVERDGERFALPDAGHGLSVAA
jgi:hypothetical protein